MALPDNYHRDWQRKRAQEDPEWYEQRKLSRSALRRSKKAGWVRQFGSSCARCNQTYPDYVFEFHHIEPNTKDFSPSQLFMLSDWRIAEEMTKCIMVCSNCHKVIHHEDNYKAHEKRKKYEH
jgi:predicted HNH restriction endonuclease